MKYLIGFQRHYGLTPDGIIGPITLRKIQEVFAITSIEATAHFVGQLAHETQYFTYGVENLSYSPSGLQRVFKKYFPTPELAIKYAHRPEDIANRVYANRMGNGPESSGDGYKFRGRGAIQLTGRAMYEKFSAYIGHDVVADPDRVQTNFYWQAAVWYFGYRGIWKHCNRVDASAIRAVTKKINGGTNGLQHRQNLTMMYYKMLSR